MSNISSLQSILKDFTKTNFNISCQLSCNSDEIHVRVHKLSNNTYRVHSFAQQLFHKADYMTVTRLIIDQLVLYDDCIIGFGPVYQENFAVLMEQLLYSEYKHGKLY